VNAAKLEGLALLADLDAEEREAVAEWLEELCFEPGALLFAEGEPAEGLLLVAEGGVRVESSRHAERVELGPGAALGAFSLVASGPREARAETTSRTRLWQLSRSSFRRLADESPRAACRLLEAILRDAVLLSRAVLAQAAAGVDPAPPPD
jgi:CRP-like cAMP-binding protein